MSDRDELLEDLSALEHEQWIHWSKSVYDSIEKLIELIDVDSLSQEDVQFIETQKERLARWESYWVDYDELSEKVKEQDRKYARKIIQMFEK